MPKILVEVEVGVVSLAEIVEDRVLMTDPRICLIENLYFFAKDSYW